MKENQRNSSLEVLRIIAMCMIITIHIAPIIDLNSFGFVKYWGASIVGICNAGVSCFVLISGYFGIKFNLRKLIKLEIMVIMFSLLETAILYVAMPETLPGMKLVEQVGKSLLPFTSRKYWFYSGYICVYIFSGYIEKLISILSHKEFQRLVGLIIGIFSILPTMFYFEIMQDAGKGVLQIFMLYLVGRYIKLYKDISIDKGLCIIILAVIWWLNVQSIKYPLRLGDMVHSLCRDNSITNIIIAVLLLYIFKEIKIYSKVINKITSHMFAVFALENAIVLITAKWINDSYFETKGEFLPGMAFCGIIIGIFLICIVIGVLREAIFGKLEDRVVIPKIIGRINIGK